MIIAIDFDNTITVGNNFPKIGKVRKNAIEVIKNLQKHGHKCFLWTCRAGKYLEDAKNFLESKGLVMEGYNVSELDSVNNGRKPIADIYIDDCNIFTKSIDWKQIEKYILSDEKNIQNLIEKRRETFKEKIGNLKGAIIENADFSLKVKFNGFSINKLSCNKSLKKSLESGFTIDEHFTAAENIKTIFENATIYSSTYGRINDNEFQEKYYGYYFLNFEKTKIAYLTIILRSELKNVSVNKVSIIDMYLSKEKID